MASRTLNIKTFRNETRKSWITTSVEQNKKLKAIGWLGFGKPSSKQTETKFTSQTCYPVVCLCSVAPFPPRHEIKFQIIWRISQAGNFKAHRQSLGFEIKHFSVRQTSPVASRVGILITNSERQFSGSNCNGNFVNLGFSSYPEENSLGKSLHISKSPFLSSRATAGWQKHTRNLFLNFSSSYFLSSCSVHEKSRKLFLSRVEVFIFILIFETFVKIKCTSGLETSWGVRSDVDSWHRCGWGRKAGMEEIGGFN